MESAHGTRADPDNEKYLHSLPDTAQKNLDAFERILRIRQD